MAAGGRRLALAACAALGLALAAAGAERVREGLDRLRHPPPGVMLPVGARRLQVQCAGSGRPLILLEAGLDDDSTVWDKVFTPLSRIARTCRYDRAGLGWSSDAGADGSPGQALSDLSAVLRYAGPPPYLLVGHSFGGLIVRAYAERRLADVAGIVLIDSASEGQFKAGLPDPFTYEAFDLKPAAAIFGLMRLAPRDGPPEQSPAGLALSRRASRYRTVQRTALRLADYDRAVAVHPSLGGTPLAVITAGRKPAALRPVWLRLQDRLAGLSSCSRHVVLAGAGHYVQVERPAVVIDAVRTLAGAPPGACPWLPSRRTGRSPPAAHIAPL